MKWNRRRRRKRRDMKEGGVTVLKIGKVGERKNRRRKSWSTNRRSKKMTLKQS